MPDRKKVIRAWECCNPFNRECNECPYEKDCYHDGISRHMVADAIILLKEQEDLGAELTNAVELIHKKNERIEKLMKEQPQIVRCKDCIWFHKPDAETKRSRPCKCNYHGGVTEGDRYCWWGEKDA